ncbi:T9SS type A sorting domain-containing protein [candidate division KSB1 bacterium]|nr:T9SS type A sorting domain-containing protein [candidate division KSB1 bacterium]
MRKSIVVFLIALMTHGVIMGQEVSKLSLNPKSNVSPGSRVSLPLIFTSDSLMSAIEFTLTYDSTMLAVIGYDDGKDLPDGFTISIDTVIQVSPPLNSFHQFIHVSIMGDGKNSLSGRNLELVNLDIRILGLRGSASLNFIPETVWMETIHSRRFGGDAIKLSNAVLPIDEVITTSLNLMAASSKIIEGDEFTIVVQISRVYDLHSFDISIQYDPRILRVKSVSEGSLLSEQNTSSVFWSPPVIDNASGRVLHMRGVRLSPNGINGSGEAAIITFKAFSSGMTSIKFDAATCKLLDAHNFPISIKTMSDLELNLYRNSAARLFLPDTIGILNQRIDIPVTISNVQTSSIISGLFHVSCDTNVLQPLGVHTSGTIINNWQSPVAMVDGGTIRFAIAGYEPLTTDGILIYLQYRVNPKASEGDTTAIEFTHVLLNEGDPTFLTRNGRMEVDGLQLTGTITYGGTQTPIPEVQLNLIGEQTRTTLSDDEGKYSFTEIHYENYSLHPSLQGNAGTCITPFDAALLLQHIVKVTRLTPYQLIAANVSGDATLSAYDASAILQYSVGSIERFPISSDELDIWRFVPTNFLITDTNWNTAPDAIMYEPLTTDLFNQNFIGMVYGDISQNWLPPTLTKALAAANSSTVNELLWGDITRDQETSYKIPILLNTESAVASVELDIKFNPDEVDIAAISYADNFLTAHHITNNTIRIAMASAHPESHRGELLTIHFMTSEFPERDIFDIERAVLNEDDVLIATHVPGSGDATNPPDQCELYQNYPNPFNSETKIAFTVTRSQEVTLTIVSIDGRPVRKLLDQRLSHGNYTIHWNGKDDRGSTVASGTYVMLLTTSEQRLVRKIVYLK